MDHVFTVYSLSRVASVPMPAAVHRWLPGTGWIRGNPAGMPSTQTSCVPCAFRRGTGLPRLPAATNTAQSCPLVPERRGEEGGDPYKLRRCCFPWDPCPGAHGGAEELRSRRAWARRPATSHCDNCAPLSSLLLRLPELFQVSHTITFKEISQVAQPRHSVRERFAWAAEGFPSIQPCPRPVPLRPGSPSPPLRRPIPVRPGKARGQA